MEHDTRGLSRPGVDTEELLSGLEEILCAHIREASRVPEACRGKGWPLRVRRDKGQPRPNTRPHSDVTETEPMSEVCPRS